MEHSGQRATQSSPSFVVPAQFAMRRLTWASSTECSLLEGAPRASGTEPGPRRDRPAPEPLCHTVTGHRRRHRVPGCPQRAWAPHQPQAPFHPTQRWDSRCITGILAETEAPSDKQGVRETESPQRKYGQRWCWEQHRGAGLASVQSQAPVWPQVPLALGPTQRRAPHLAAMWHLHL